jgi:hypothetical protein
MGQAGWRVCRCPARIGVGPFLLKTGLRTFASVLAAYRNSRRIPDGWRLAVLSRRRASLFAPLLTIGKLYSSSPFRKVHEGIKCAARRSQCYDRRCPSALCTPLARWSQGSDYDRLRAGIYKLVLSSTLSPIPGFCTGTGMRCSCPIALRSRGNWRPGHVS